MDLHPLRAYRQKHNKPLEEIAVRVGVTRQSLSRIERGKQKPSLDLIDKLVTVTGGKVKADDFLPSRRGA